MSNTLPDKREKAITGKPLQRISWKEKNSNKKEWFKNNADYYIGQGNFTPGAQSGKRDLDLLYNVYNNKFPLSWFAHITDPLNATNANHKKFPSKIRPTGMLRTNIDLLLGEYPKRPFNYQVQNLGEDAYNSYLENLTKAVETNLQEHFLAVAQQAMAEAGHDFQQIPQEQEIELPESVKDRFTLKYKDKLALRAQKWTRRAITEYHIKQKLHKMYKHWLIAGSAYSYKNIINGNFVYDVVPVKELRYGGSPEKEFVEDKEWWVRRRLLSVSDVVGEFYDDLTEEDHIQLEQRNSWSTPMHMFNYLSKEAGTNDSGLIPVYHVAWRGLKPIMYVSYTDPLTGKTQEMTLDEDTPIDETMKVNKTVWVEEIYEASVIGDNIYTRMRPIPVQRNQMNNFSSCKGPYNGRNYSDLHSENISVLEMGLPYAIGYMIVNYTLEKTIAKNKGKIALIDQQSIPRTNGWDEEKFFYYAEALGYALINRSQAGVDKAWNQYQVLDMSLWDQIEKLIVLRDSFINDWDRLLGINPQRKAQIGSSDGLGTTQTALFQSTVITDMINTTFEELIERDLQGILDFSRFINVDGVRAIYNQDDYDRELLEIDPNSYCYAELGLFYTYSAQELQNLQQFKQQIPQMAQGGARQSTLLEIQRANSVEELIGKLKALEEMEIQQAQAASDDEHKKQMEIEQIKERFLQIQSDLKINEINAEYDRKNELEMIKGEYSLFGFGGDGDNNDNGIPDAVEISKRIISQQQILSAERIKGAELNQKNKEHEGKMKVEDKKLQLERDKMKLEREKIRIEQQMQENEMEQQEKLNKQQLALGEQKIRTAQIQAKKAAQKPKPSSKK